MPFTPYHFGPSGLIGLIFQKWIDIPVFLLANVIVDLEVLVISSLGLGYPIHRYVHTLLIGAGAGTAWALAAWPLRNIFKKIMQILHIPYKTSLLKMIISGILGVWLHVIIDSIYHPDVRLFWPYKSIPLWRIITRQHVEFLCLVAIIPALILYLLTVILSWNKIEAEKEHKKKGKNNGSS
jgi:membrane-bound metal-dependent hydrolase YbcI (DUF457 family)